MKINLKFTIQKIAELEKAFNQPLENLIADTRFETIATIVSKGYVNEDGHVGCSLNIAYDKIGEYLAECKNGKQDIMLDIIEELVAEGFLPEAMSNTRALMNEKMEEATKLMK